MSSSSFSHLSSFSSLHPLFLSLSLSPSLSVNCWIIGCTYWREKKKNVIIITRRRRKVDEAATNKGRKKEVQVLMMATSNCIFNTWTLDSHLLRQSTNWVETNPVLTILTFPFFISLYFALTNLNLASVFTVFFSPSWIGVKSQTKWKYICMTVGLEGSKKEEEERWTRIETTSDWNKIHLNDEPFLLHHQKLPKPGVEFWHWWYPSLEQERKKEIKREVVSSIAAAAAASFKYFSRPWIWRKKHKMDTEIEEEDAKE